MSESLPPLPPVPSTEPWPRTDLVHPDGRAFHVYGERHGTLEKQSPDTGHDVASLHRRFDRLTGAWVLVSPARNSRPGGVITTTAAPVCPLCPSGPELPWPYDAAVFDNRFPSLSVDAPSPARSPAGSPSPSDEGALTAASLGRCEVIVYTSEHHGSLASLSPSQLVRVVAVWRDRSTALWAEGHSCVMAFENRGAAVGATLSHPHGQIYAFAHLPPTTVAKVQAHQAHRTEYGACLGCALNTSDEGSERIVARNDSFVVAVPFAARWPYEVHIRSRRHGLGRLSQLDDREVLDLAAALHEVVARLDGLFGFEMPFMLTVQEAPVEPERTATSVGEPDWHLHVEVIPPHRSADRLKVRASVETALGQFINDTLPEASSAQLRAVEIGPVDFREVPVPHIVVGDA